MVTSQELRQRIVIKRSTSSQDEDGFTVISWDVYKKPWAKINGLFGKEYWEAKKYEAENTVVFTIRFKSCPDLSINDIIEFRGNVYNITSVDNVMFLNQELKIKAEVSLK